MRGEFKYLSFQSSENQTDAALLCAGIHSPGEDDCHHLLLSSSYHGPVLPPGTSWAQDLPPFVPVS